MEKMRQWITTASCGIGNTLLVENQGPGISLFLVGCFIINMTSTINLVEIGFREGPRGPVHFRDLTQNAGDRAYWEMQEQPWMLAEGKALLFNAAATTGSTPFLMVTVYGFDGRRS